MANPASILRDLDTERFHTLLFASPKSFREELFRHAGIKVKGGAFSVKAMNKNKARANKLHAALQNGLELEANILEELIRNYLYTQRSLLADALDQLGVPHEDGLTDEDLGFIDDLDPEKGEALKKHLEEKHEAEDVRLYLAFMKIPGA